MTKQEYLKALGEALSALVPAKDRTDILHYYKEYFEEAGAENEASVIEELGDPAELARKIAREGGFSGGEPDAGEAPSRKSRNWAVIGVIVALLAVLVIAVVLLAMTFFAVTNGPSEPNGPSGPDDTVASTVIADGSEVAEEPPAPSQTGGEPGTAEPVEQFTAIDVEIGVGEITVQTGDDFAILVESAGKDKSGTDYEIQYQLQRNKLRVWSTPQDVQTGNGNDISGNVVITVPESWALGEIELKTGVGNIALDGFLADEVDAKTGVGDMTVKQVAVTELSMTSGVGGIMLEGALGRETELKTGVGDITVDADCSAEDCAYELKAAAGDLQVDGQRFVMKAKKEKGSAYELEAETGVGDIEVCFAE